MIDGINITYNAPPETDVKKWNFWEVLCNVKTKEPTTDKYITDFRGLKMTLRKSTLLSGGYLLNIKGSLHKYLNCGKHNADRFTFLDLVRSIDSLTDITGIEPDKFSLHGLEIGVNIPLSFAPVKVLRNIVCYGNKGVNQIDKRSIKTGLRCTLKQYEVKIYDKGRQSRTGGNVLRLEVSFNKMQALKKYDLQTLDDLTKLEKVYPLISVLLDMQSRIIWTDRNADLNRMTDREQKKFLYYSNATNWQGMDKRRKVYHLKKWDLLLKKYGNIYNLQPDILTEWQQLFSELKADFTKPFYQLDPKSKQLKNVTFLHVDKSVKKLQKTPDKTDLKQFKNNNNIKKSKKAEPTKRRFCQSCGKEITHQSKKSRFCSSKYVGEKQAHRCRNKDSNKRLSKKRKIKRAMKNNKLLRISYKDKTGEIYTDVLHTSELHVNKKWLDRVVKLETVPNNPCRKVRTYTGDNAKKVLQSQTKIQNHESKQSKQVCRGYTAKGSRI